ncbi:MAG: hypothetical protein AAB458_00870 [Patescibacteria group bacterium]
METHFKKLYIALFFGLFISVSFAFAQGTPNPGPVQIVNPLKFDSIQEVVVEAAKAATTIGFYVAVFFIIYSGFLFVKARGNEEALKSAKKTLLYTLIGTAVLLGATVLANVIKGTLDQIRAGTNSAEIIHFG